VPDDGPNGFVKTSAEMDQILGFGRTVFFVKDAEEALTFYTKTLGFTLDWNYQEEGRAFVIQVSLFGHQLILNQVHGYIQDRAGHGRIFFGLEQEQATALLQYIHERGIKATREWWGNPTLVIRDFDGNELFFWMPEKEWEGVDLPPTSPPL
jgi:catechol 2,3-dioxygenase-like lactoylglutathione lyase family enzyme